MTKLRAFQLLNFLFSWESIFSQRYNTCNANWIKKKIKAVLQISLPYATIRDIPRSTQNAFIHLKRMPTNVAFDFIQIISSNQYLITLWFSALWNAYVLLWIRMETK